SVEELMSQGQHRVEIRCQGAPLIEMPARWNGVVTRSEHPEGTAFQVEDHARVNEVVQWLMQAGVTLRAVTPQRANLEDLLLSAAEQAPNAVRDSGVHLAQGH